MMYNQEYRYRATIKDFHIEKRNPSDLTDSNPHSFLNTAIESGVTISSVIHSPSFLLIQQLYYIIRRQHSLIVSESLYSGVVLRKGVILLFL